MDPPSLIDQDDDVFVDTLHQCPAQSSPEPSNSASTLSDPLPEPKPHSPANTIRRRPVRRGAPATQSSDSSIVTDLIDGDSTRSFRHRQRHRNLNKNENSEEKPDSGEPQQANYPLPEENNEGSTITSAANDDAACDSVDSAPRLGDSSSSFLELAAGLVIHLLGFQMKLVFMFITYPFLFMFYSCMFFMDPLGTTRKGKDFAVGIVNRVWCSVFSCIRPYVNIWVKENDSFWSVAFRWGWGFLWSMYVGCVLFGLLVSSFVFSGFVMKCLVEKPIQMREVLNFDYTKLSPVAYVPVMSCAGVIGGRGSENMVDPSKWVGERVIPSKHKVQVTVELRVPESGYNRNLGIFQTRVDFLFSNGKAIASSSQPCMLRFRSEPIRLITTFLKIAPLLTGYISETQTLNVKLRGFIEGDIPTSCLKVTLEQRAEYQPGAGIPEIYDASLIIESELPLFKRIIWLWKMSIFIWITMMAFFTELLFALVFCTPIIIPKTRQRVASARVPAALDHLQAQN